MSVDYCLYGTGLQSISHEALLKEQQEEKILWARVENSGSEGMYVEVAKWNAKHGRWERYCFQKFFSGQGEHEAERFADEINKFVDQVDIIIIHRMPDYHN